MKAVKSGIDIAHYQSEPKPVDWAVVKAAMEADGITNQVAFKATQGTTFTDPWFTRHRVGASFCQYRLLYHFINWKPGTMIQSAMDQANYFLKVVGTLQPGEAAMVDGEVFAVPGMTPAQIAAYYREEALFCDVFCDVVEQKTQRPCMVYSIKQMWRTPELNNGKRGMIMAWWPGGTVTAAENADDQARAKALPYIGDTPLAAWQWSASGTFAGVYEAVDLDMVLDESFFQKATGTLPPPPPPPPLYHGHATIRLGDSGRDVMVLEHELNRLNYNITEDGTFDRELENAVIYYQHSRGLVEDGICGTKQTWPALLSNKPPVT